MSDQNKERTEPTQSGDAEIRHLSELAWAASRAGDGEGEYRCGREMMTRFPDHPGGWFHTARAGRQLGRLDEIETLLADAPARFPKDRGVLSIWVSLARARGDRQEALRRAEWYRERFPDDPGGYTHMSRVLNFCGRHEEAKVTAEEALRRWPADVGLRDAVSEAEDAINRREVSE